MLMHPCPDQQGGTIGRLMWRRPGMLPSRGEMVGGYE